MGEKKQRYILRSSRIRSMFRMGRFVYFCPKCNKHFQSRLLWNECYCPYCEYGRTIMEDLEFYVNMKSGVY